MAEKQFPLGTAPEFRISVGHEQLGGPWMLGITDPGVAWSLTQQSLHLGLGKTLGGHDSTLCFINYCSITLPIEC